MWWVRELSRIADVVQSSRQWVPSQLHEAEVEQVWVALESIVEVMTGESMPSADQATFTFGETA
jgi:hypothetical protein